MNAIGNNAGFALSCHYDRRQIAPQGGEIERSASCVKRLAARIVEHDGNRASFHQAACGVVDMAAYAVAPRYEHHRRTRPNAAGMQHGDEFADRQQSARKVAGSRACAQRNSREGDRG
jgi:hypothetical protein